eukprot:1149059-Pyramimonas_sp.AAC.2
MIHRLLALRNLLPEHQFFTLMHSDADWRDPYPDSFCFASSYALPCATPVVRSPVRIMLTTNERVLYSNQDGSGFMLRKRIVKTGPDWLIGRNVTRWCQT